MKRLACTTLYPLNFLFQISSHLRAIPEGLIEKVGFTLYGFRFSTIYSKFSMAIVLHVPREGE